MKLNWNFQRGLGLRKIPSVGEVWIFFGITQRYFLQGQPKAATGHKMMPFVPFVFSKSRFQGPAFRCDKIVVRVTLLEAIEGIPDKDYNVGGAKTSTNFTTTS